MIKEASVLLLAIFGGVWASQGDTPWGYGKSTEGVYGPADWHKGFHHCGGNAQSPIDIDDCKVTVSKSLGPVKVTFDKPMGLVTGKLVNNGHAPTLTLDRSAGTAHISGGPLGSHTYELLQFHFHFGCKAGVGSEHTLNGKGKSGELHLVFFNKKYSADEAAAKHDGLAVIGVFLQSAKRTGRTLKKLIMKKVEQVDEEGSSVDVTPDDRITLKGLVPMLTKHFSAYKTYKGSLTTPPCYQSVQWLVSDKKIGISAKHLKVFRTLKAGHGFQHGKMCNNNRPTMPLNGRKILTTP